MPPNKNSLIHKLSHLSHHFKHARFSKLEQVGLYQGQPRLLSTLRQYDGISQKELADRINITPATLTRMLQRMEKNALLVRRPDDRDQRITRVFILDKAIDVLSDLERINKTMEDKIFADFSPEDKKQFAAYLDLIIARMHHDSQEKKQ